LPSNHCPQCTLFAVSIIRPQTNAEWLYDNPDDVLPVPDDGTGLADEAKEAVAGVDSGIEAEPASEAAIPAESAIVVPGNLVRSLLHSHCGPDPNKDPPIKRPFSCLLSPQQFSLTFRVSPLERSGPSQPWCAANADSAGKPVVKFRCPPVAWLCGITDGLMSLLGLFAIRSHEFPPQTDQIAKLQATWANFTRNATPDSEDDSTDVVVEVKLDTAAVAICIRVLRLIFVVLCGTIPFKIQSVLGVHSLLSAAALVL